MSGSVNKVILVGNLGRDPEVRTFPSGDKVVSFSMAMTESWRDKATGSIANAVRIFASAKTAAGG